MEKLINWFKSRGPFLATVILLLAIPMYPKFPLQAVEGTYVSIRLIDFLAAGGIFICMVSQLLKGFPILKSRIFKLFVLYWIAGLVANLAAFGITDLVSFKLAMLHWARRVEYMSLFFLAYQSLIKKKDLKDVKAFIGLSFLGVFIYGIGQKFWHWPVVSTMNEEFSKGMLLYLDRWTRINSTFAGHYDLAAWLVMILAIIPVAVAGTKNWLGKIGGFILGILGLYLLILTASRVSYIAYLIGIASTLLLLRKFKWIGPVLIISLFFGFTSKELNARLRSTLKSFPQLDKKIAQVTEIWETESEKIAYQIKNIKLKRRKLTPTPESLQPEPTEVPVEEVGVTPEKEKKEKIVKELRTWPTREEAEAAAARSSNIRFQVEWPRAIKAFLKNPLTGTGFSSLGLATDNDYLRLLGETGIVGFASFMLIISHLLITFWKRVKNKLFSWHYSAGLIGLLAGILANAIFIDIFEASKVAFYFWLLMGIGYKITKSEARSTKSPKESDTQTLRSHRTETN